ncbi:hypothetical protein [Bartonella henselae]|uniref:Uncharacterized protein n=1 Tax=Bartonella henselae (strain ATCC 49882 / DSM 28221 / CCUG 30454 / Houston 1) TaxID=283166 RepID=A0A0H3LWZ3_BARHE|nr:hypothetical protein [Bartonella henselae]ATP12242.1 hypothetical protein BhenCHDE101_03365 [Bartonella henselae]OLL37622.1 hypothetical protein AT244_01975 [Bartonella henselae]OLL47499.1 hypothetical protein AT245_03950 [Bartonella henselae]PNM38364.1 hypothetical protein AL470_002635 [Bartonella henselae str. Houston-1]UAK84900.1 hypothetical protein K8O99_04105 [Bartonella henselae]
MFMNSILRILMAVIFCFSQIVEVNANLWRCRSQESTFMIMVAQEKDILVQATNRVFIGISSQNARENDRSIIKQKAEKVIFTAIAIFLGTLALKMVGVFKRWVGTRFSQAFEDWRDSLYY